MSLDVQLECNRCGALFPCNITFANMDEFNNADLTGKTQQCPVCMKSAIVDREYLIVSE